MSGDGFTSDGEYYLLSLGVVSPLLAFPGNFDQDDDSHPPEEDLPPYAVIDPLANEVEDELEPILPGYESNPY